MPKPPITIKRIPAKPYRWTNLTPASKRVKRSISQLKRHIEGVQPSASLDELMKQQNIIVVDETQQTVTP